MKIQLANTGFGKFVRDYSIPNKLTILRLVLIVPVYLMLMNHVYLWALILYITGSLTDLLDGFLARVCCAESNFGSVFDSAFDKAFVISLLILLAPAWLTIIVAIREFSVSALRQHAAELGGKVAVGFIGKLKTFVTMPVIALVIYLEMEGLSLPTVVTVSYLLVAALTILSGVIYLYKGRQYLS